ncbi:MAG TPA: translation elongation factor Ts [Patescibacteria group bacterium]|nr:translation elongation factor Ts [Patescibacteria group bacterium]
MATIDIKLLKKLRDETSISVSECRQALEEANGDYAKALSLLKARAAEKAAKKADRATGEGVIEAYIHGNGKIGVMVEVLCETDFVARTDEFKHLAHEVAMQIAAMNPKDAEELLAQEYIKDSSVTIEQMVKEAIQKTGENIKIQRFTRFEL